MSVQQVPGDLGGVADATSQPGTDQLRDVEPGGEHRSSRRQKLSWAMTTLMAGIAAVFMVPFYFLIISTLRPASRIFPDSGDLIPNTLTLENFRSAFNELPVVTWFFNSVVLAAGSTIGAIVVVTMAAYPLARMQFRGRNAIFLGVLATQMVPFYLLLIPLFLLLVNLNLIDTHLGVIVPLLAHPFGLFFMRQYMLGLPQDLIDAARVDGASEYQIFLRIIVPLVKPALATLAILFSLESWNDLLWPLIVMRNESNYPLSVGIVSQVGLFRQRWDLVMALSLLAVAPIAILFFRMRETFINGLGQLGTGSK